VEYAAVPDTVTEPPQATDEVIEEIFVATSLTCHSITNLIYEPDFNSPELPLIPYR